MRRRSHDYRGARGHRYNPYGGGHMRVLFGQQALSIVRDFADDLRRLWVRPPDPTLAVVGPLYDPYAGAHAIVVTFLKTDFVVSVNPDPHGLDLAIRVARVGGNETVARAVYRVRVQVKGAPEVIVEREAPPYLGRDPWDLDAPAMPSTAAPAPLGVVAYETTPASGRPPERHVSPDGFDFDMDESP